MRKIEQQMLRAIEGKRNWCSGNTQVQYFDEVETPTHARIEHAQVFLHGHHIATYAYKHGEREGFMTANPETLRAWPTPTTKSRLRALGVDVYTKNFVTYLNGRAL